MSTVSTLVPSPSSHSHFTVSPSSLVCSVTDVEREREGRFQLGPEGLRQHGQLRRAGELLVEAGPHLVDPIARLARQDRAELVARDVEARR